MITIYIHAGTGKTGTSAIQAFLNYNRENLFRDFSCLYPNYYVHNIQRGNNCHNHCKSIMIPEKITIADDIEKAVDFCKKNDISKIILSCEGFFGQPHIGAKIIEKFHNNAEVSFRIIVFFRRQDHFLESSWKQWGSKDIRFPSINEYIENYSIRWLDTLRKNENIFGKENIIVLPYEKEQLQDGLIGEFLKIAGIPYSGYNWINPPESNLTVNLGFNRDIIEILSLNKSFYKNIHDNTLLNFFYDTLPDMYQKKPYEKYDFLSPRQRIKILEKYEPMNQTIAREYLSRKDGKLFYEPWPGPDDPWKPYEGLTLEKIVPIYTQMLLTMEKQHQKRWNTLKNRSLKQRILMKIHEWRNHLK